jgi:hypothetical protein
MGLVRAVPYFAAAIVAVAVLRFPLLQSLSERVPAFASRPGQSAFARLRIPTLIFVIASIILFLGMSRSTAGEGYDDGITLTGAMEVAAGKIPHRDFYAIYGPAHFYVVAGLFRVFGESIFIERMLFALISGLVVTAAFCIASSYCNRTITAWATVSMALWLFAMNSVEGSALIPVSFFTLVATAILLPVFLGPLPRKRALATGILAGCATLWRYDCGVGLLAVLGGITLFARFFQTHSFSGWLKSFASTFWPVLAGFALIVVPPALYYLSVASFRDFYFDIAYFPSRFYLRARNMPFPGLRFDTVDDVVYLPIIIAAISVYTGVGYFLRLRNGRLQSTETRAEDKHWHGFLVAYSLLAIVMYAKGTVRVGPIAMYLATVPSILLIAVLLQRSRFFRTPMAFTIQCVVALCTFAVLAGALVQAFNLHDHREFLVPAILARERGHVSPLQQQWCRQPGPMSRGVCIIPMDDTIRTAEFIDAHTTPAQPLFVGAGRHDRIFINNMMLYFATQRLPVTHWAEFDTLLQNSASIQKQMIQELNTNPPPYIILDAAFDESHEPNESSKSTGVTLLDDYIHTHYRKVEAFDLQSIWQRIPIA